MGTFSSCLFQFKEIQGRVLTLRSSVSEWVPLSPRLVPLHPLAVLILPDEEEPGKPNAQTLVNWVKTSLVL